MTAPFTEGMTLDEKLAAIDALLESAVVNEQSSIDVPIDPADLLICEGCQ